LTLLTPSGVGVSTCTVRLAVLVPEIAMLVQTSITIRSARRESILKILGAPTYRSSRSSVFREGVPTMRLN
jgi:hypothetical protein